MSDLDSKLEHTAPIPGAKARSSLKLLLRRFGATMPDGETVLVKSMGKEERWVRTRGVGPESLWEQVELEPEGEPSNETAVPAAGDGSH